MTEVSIRPATEADQDALWALLEPVLRAGETYALPRDWSRADALAFWLAPEKWTFVAEAPELGIVGTYYLKANQMGPGAHVANCGYVTSARATGRGVARTMCAHSLAEARAQGFRAMQFNCVVSTNTRAVALWERMGFDTVGRLPKAFDHPAQGPVDALVMYRALS